MTPNPMNTNEPKITGTWNDDPLHFLRPKGMGRRSFLQAGMVAGLGLTLGDFFRMKAQGAAAVF